MAAIKHTPIAEAVAATGEPAVESAGWLVAGPVSIALGELVLADESHYGKLLIHGRAGGQALAALGLPDPAQMGQGARDGERQVYRLRPDHLFVITPPGQEAAALAALVAAGGDGMITVTDVTHGRAQLRLSGGRAADLLSRLCALDFHPDHFPDGTARQTSVAKTTQLVIRDDLSDGTPSYRLVGARSLGAYLWMTLLDAARRPVRS